MSKNTNLSFLTDYITADITNGRIGINNASPTVAFDVTGVANFSSSITAAKIITSTTLDGDPQLGVFTNASTGTSAEAAIYIKNGATTNDATFVETTGTGFTTTGGFIQDGGVIGTGTSLAGGLSLMVRANADMRFYTNGHTNERMRITSAGNVGIGTSSPSTKLHVYEALTNASAYLTIQNNRARNAAVYTVTSNGGFYAGTSIGTDTFNYQIYDAVAGAARLTIASTGAATFSSSVTTGGNVNLPNTSLIQFSSGDAAITNSGTTLLLKTYNGSSLATVVTITSSGNCLIGTSSDNGERLYVSGAIRATGTITANSDIRIKSNITKIENALEKVGQISGYTYNTNYDDKRHGGVIAQEIDKVFPEIVNTGNDGLMGVEYGNISALLIEAIKELSAEITILKNK